MQKNVWRGFDCNWIDCTKSIQSFKCFAKCNTTRSVKKVTENIKKNWKITFQFIYLHDFYKRTQNSKTKKKYPKYTPWIVNAFKNSELILITRIYCLDKQECMREYNDLRM